MNESRTFTVAIPPRTELLSANGRLNRYVAARRVKNLRTVAHQLARIQRIPRLERVEVIGLVHAPNDGRRRDPHNWAPTLKACVDGLVDAGVLADDNADVLVRTAFALGEGAQYLSFSLLIREVAQ